MAISQNTALFSLLGTTYGGDGRSTFALPDLQGSAPLQQGQGLGLSLRDLGEAGGEPSLALLTQEIPAHTHAVRAASLPGSSVSPQGGTWAIPGAGRGLVAYDAQGGGGSMSGQAVAIAGSSLPHNNMPPYLTLNFIIALQGVYPARS
jgi:microcystin-dependent protein